MNPALNSEFPVVRRCQNPGFSIGAVFRTANGKVRTNRNKIMFFRRSEVPGLSERQ